METFEIHITGSTEQILTDLSDLGLKGIHISLLKPDGTVLRDEFMSSIVERFKNFDECLKWVNGLCLMLEAKGNHIVRRKIETPYYHHYINKCVYMEAHFKIDKIEKNIIHPVARNNKSGKLLATQRIYDSQLYNTLIKLSDVMEVEMCLYDTYISEDFDWMDSYKNNLYL